MKGINKTNVLKAGIFYTISNFFVKGLVFITMPLFTRIMTKTEIGEFSNITSWFAILSIVTTFEIYSSVSIARFDYKDNLDDYISSSLLLGSFITSLFYIIVLIFNKFFQKLFMMNFETLNIIFIYLLVYPSIQMFQIKNQITYNYKPTVIISIINAITSTMFSILLVFLMTNHLRGRIIGYYIPLILSSLIIYIYLLNKGKKISTKYWKYAFAISFPLIWHLLSGYLLTSADKIMITKMISPEANALYSVAYTISMVVTILWNSMNNAWSPWAYDKMDKKEYDSLKKYSKPYSIFFIAIVFIIMLVTPELLLIMGGKNYLEAKYVMPPVMLGYIFQFMYSLLVNIEFYHKKQKNIAIGTMIAAILNIMLNAILLPKFGYIAAAYTTLIGYIALYIIHLVLVYKLKCEWWYDIKFFYNILLISTVFMFTCLMLYINNVIRYITILITIVLILSTIYKLRKEIIDSIKKKNFNIILEKINKKKGESV